MEITEGSSIFLDTNVLVYRTIPESPFHRFAVDVIHALEQEGSTLWISRQVLREYLVTLTRPGLFSEPIPLERVLQEIRFFENYFHVADEHQTLTERLLSLMETINIAGRQVHDANIVATMQAYGLSRLLTQNIEDFQRFADLITIQPLIMPDQEYTDTSEESLSS